MKKLLLLFFLFNSFIKAQVGFCPKGAQWHYLFSHWVPSGLKNKTITSGNTIVQNGDTIKVLYHDFFFVAYNNGTIGYTYIKQKGDTVFMKNTCTNNQWQVLYNFAAAPGQSWYNTFTSGNYVIQFTVTVNSVNLVQFGNKLVRQLNVTYQSSSNASYPGSTYSGTIHEYFGDTKYVFNFYCRTLSDTMDQWYSALCYQDDENGLTQFSGSDCNFSYQVGLGENQRGGKLRVLFDPDRNKYLVEGADPGASLSVMDLTGRIVTKRSAGDSASCELDLTGCESGIYLLVIDHNAQVGSFRLVID